MVAALLLISTFFVSLLGQDSLRAAKSFFLYLPFGIFIFWGLKKKDIGCFSRVFVWIATSIFYIDGIVRYFLKEAYGASPESSLVLEAAANTNIRESAEYLFANSVRFLILGSGLLALMLFSGKLLMIARADATNSSRLLSGFILLLMLVSVVAHLSKPWRRLHPVFFWQDWYKSVSVVKSNWKTQASSREDQLFRANAISPKIDRKGGSVVVLVIADSINRDNMGVYGYKRNTTPILSLRRKELGRDMVIFRDAWSLDASTVPAFESMFSLQAADGEQSVHLMAMARSAGYKIWWVSNHDDVAIESRHAAYADTVEMVNRTPGRSSSSLDGEVLEGLEMALNDSAEKKFIVVHLLGAHPHYALRYPKNENPFSQTMDDIDYEMQEKKRSFWVKGFREQYDSAILYHDSVVSKTLDLTRFAGKSPYRAWIYLSDHGQEVGHLLDKAGHSPTTESGYRIPAMIWRNDIGSEGEMGAGERKFRSDWMAWAVADLLSLQWKNKNTNLSILSENYQWIPPEYKFKPTYK